ncbi:hypothetical protein E2C01_009743 [Portunus trituberculatus]|uniref:Uncharacterized protein n=1 Tax=Portunus trituberculatus TaxID=210409 RepID=A0A5B7D6K9_PORTR|nr:hypothetical protein [Portunus trituberculatus]
MHETPREATIDDRQVWEVNIHTQTGTHPHPSTSISTPDPKQLPDKPQMLFSFHHSPGLVDCWPSLTVVRDFSARITFREPPVVMEYHQIEPRFHTFV